jgi:hypothetical protein
MEETTFVKRKFTEITEMLVKQKDKKGIGREMDEGRGRRHKGTNRA